jgi:hypothetical protein
VGESGERSEAGSKKWWWAKRLEDERLLVPLRSQESGARSQEVRAS